MTANRPDLLDVISLLLDWRFILPFRADLTYVNKSTNHAREMELHADPRHASYVAVDKATGTVWSYNEERRETIVAGEPVPSFPYQLPALPDFAQLPFPLTLPVWGRRHDMFRMQRVNEHEDNLVVSLQGHRDWAGHHASLTINRQRGLVTRFDAPDRLVEIEGIDLAESLYEPR